MREAAIIERQQKARYPGLRVRREGEAVVVHIPARLHRRNGRRMILTETPESAPPEPDRDANRTLIQAIANAHHWQVCPGIAAGDAGTSSNPANTPAWRTWPATSAWTAATSAGCSA